MAMNNTVSAEDLSFDTEVAHGLQFEELQSSASSARMRRNSAANISSLAGDWSRITVLLVCMTAFCTLGAFYIAAFARITLQAQTIRSVDVQLANASAHHEALVKSLAELESDHHIAPWAAKISMSQDYSRRFIDVVPAVSARREVASAF